MRAVYKLLKYLKLSMVLILTGILFQILANLNSKIFLNYRQSDHVCATHVKNITNRKVLAVTCSE